MFTQFFCFKEPSKKSQFLFLLKNNYTLLSEIRLTTLCIFLRWRGRNPNATNELNPKTLTSGLDDYPRASHPTDEERHIDLTCWMAIASQTMVLLMVLDTRKQYNNVHYLQALVADKIGQSSEKYFNTFIALSDPMQMNRLFWSEQLRRYADFGLHTDAVKLGRNFKNESYVRMVFIKYTN